MRIKMAKAWSTPMRHRDLFMHQVFIEIKGFSDDSNKTHKIAIGSFKDELMNQIQLLNLNEETKKFELVKEVDVKYPLTKLIWQPHKTTNNSELLATSGEFLKLWSSNTDDPNLKLKADLINQNHFNAPLTSFDWNSQEPSLIGTASVDTTCTIWDINKQSVFTQLIAHDKEVYDISFSQDQHQFASVGADGSLRQFDLRQLECSNVLYEANNPLLKLIIYQLWKWDLKVSVYWIQGKLYSRVPMLPLATFKNHSDNVNGLAWAPQSGKHICTVADDQQALIWSIEPIKNLHQQEITEPLLNYKADDKIQNVTWSQHQINWIGICFKETLQILKV